jgi:hypothetical protein
MVLCSLLHDLHGILKRVSASGIAGDAKGQFSFYYSAWVCVVTSYHLLDAWLIAADDSKGVKAFITSWPNRAPAWLCIMPLSLSTLVSSRVL